MAEIMDVSRHQGVIDWAKVKASGRVDGVMIRAMGNSAAGRPSAPYTDPQFARNYAECKRLGIPCGVYGYFKAVNREQSDKELAYFKKLLTGRGAEAAGQGRADQPDGSHAEHGGKLGRVRSALHRPLVRQYLPLHGRCRAEALRRVAGRISHEEAHSRLALWDVAVHQHCPRSRCEHQC